jgi:hypothetical protein
MAEDITYPTLDYFGQLGVVLIDAGTMQTDKYGLSTCTAKWRTKASNWASFPKLSSSHPIFTTLTGEKRETALVGPWAFCTMGYAGLDPIDTGSGNKTESTPIYELVKGVSEDAIETHPKFLSTIGGKPTAPLHGATFRFVKTGWITDGATPATEDTGAVFDSFTLMKVGNDDEGNLVSDGGKNPFASIKSYFNPSKVTWRKTWVSTSNPKNNNSAGKRQTPPGDPPSIQGNWLNMGFSSTQRGQVFMISEEWLASGPQGWNSVIYPSA